jgi:Tol biopolymer transport system component
MNARRVLWILIPMLSVVVLVGGGALAWLLLRPQAAPVRLLIMGPDTKVRLLEDDGNERLLASDASTDGYGFPAPSPDGRQLAYVVADADGAAVVQLDLASGARTELYRSQENIPLDLAWSPDSKYLVFLLNGGRSVHVAAADGSQPAQLIAFGQPSFFAWSPTSATLLLHLKGHTAEGGHIDTYQPGAEKSSQMLGDPGLFQAPAWAIDGKHFFYVAQPPIESAELSEENVKSDIVRVTVDGKEPTTLAHEGLAVLRMVRSPTSDLLAYAVLNRDGLGALKLVDGSGGDVRVLSRDGERVTAFFWSPDGKQIAYLTHDDPYEIDGPRKWHLVDIASGAVRDLAHFKPSAAFAGLQLFFDAYTFSFSPWSPDGSRLTYGAEDGVYVIDIAAGSASRKTDGGLGMWVGGR